MVLVVLRLEDNINVPSLQEPLSIDQCFKNSALHELMLQWAFNLKSYASIFFLKVERAIELTDISMFFIVLLYWHTSLGCFKYVYRTILLNSK